MCDNLKNMKGLYLLCKNIGINTNIYDQYIKDKRLMFINKLYNDIPYSHHKKCFCNYNCKHCWKYTCEGCDKGYNDISLRCKNIRCYYYLKHNIPKLFEEPDKNISLIFSKHYLTFNEANIFEINLEDGYKLIFVKLLF
jgi:hypothetical protein